MANALIEKKRINLGDANYYSAKLTEIRSQLLENATSLQKLQENATYARTFRLSQSYNWKPSTDNASDFDKIFRMEIAPQGYEAELCNSGPYRKLRITKFDMNIHTITNVISETPARGSSEADRICQIGSA